MSTLTQGPLAIGAPVFNCSTCGCSELDRLLESGKHDCSSPTDRLTDLTLPEQLRSARDSSSARIALCLSATPQLVSAAVQSTGPLLGGPQRQSRIGLSCSGPSGELDQLVTIIGVWLFVRSLLRGCQPLLQLS